MVLETTPALYFLLLSTSLSSNFAWVPLAFVLLFLFAGSKYYNSLWRTTIQVPEVTSNVSRVPHHVRDFSSVDPIFPSLQKPTFLIFNSMWNIADEELLCGCPLSWIKDLVYIICVYCSYWGVLTLGEETQVIRVQKFAWRSAPRQLNVFQKTHENSFL